MTKSKRVLMVPVEIDGLEATAIRIDEHVTALCSNADSRMGVTEMVIVRAMRASWHTARNRYEWTRIANAIDHDAVKRVGEKREKKAYRRLVTAGLIRARKHSRDYLYELNLDWEPSK
jgi:hypothetical protein